MFFCFPVTIPATTTTNTVTSQGTFSNFKTVPSTETEKSLKGAYIANRLTKDLGLTKEQSAGVVGNLWAESSLIPDRIQGSGIKRGTLPEAGKLGYGWAQYTHPSLKSDLIQFAKGKGIDLNTQPMTDELNYEYLKRWISKRSSKLTALKSKSDMRSATEYFLKQYERPKDQSQQQVDKRLRFPSHDPAELPVHLIIYY